ncbi:PAS domain-containing sensor histidine kinase [Natrarchaeobius chitinivorans]|uniref:histidine kinase n=1 Tax=Natrarchaeobius chitinivorans TaxID=1679083 RepID=A0A3N6PA22_NATCH|nr:PAS domain-containing protein [Natrarchaeobius chitinivorans]RQG95889.1 PAS domain S-box protein [Natrarchaeobius chitinivorans]
MTRRSVPIVDRVTDAFFALDTDFRFTYVNDRAETLLKRSRAELIGRVMWDEFPQTVETQFPDGFHRAMDEQVPVSFEIYHAQLETWFEAQAYPSEDGLSVYMRDVTDRKSQETTLAQHAAVVEAVHDGIATLDRNREIVTVNTAMEEFLGSDRDELVGEHVEIVPELAAIDDDDAIEIGRAITDVDIGTAETRTVEAPFTDADGTDRMGEFRFVPIEDDTATVAVVVRDVTDQYEYERIAASLHEITRWLLESDDRQEICAIAVHAGSDLLDLPISGVWLLEQEQGYLEPVAGTAGAHDEFGGLPRFHPNEGLVWEVFEAGDVERFDDLEAVDGLYNPETPIRSEIIAPIGTHGVIMTGSLEPHQFDETDVELVSTLAENTRAALDRAARERVLRERTSELERQTERLEGIADVLSNDLKRQLKSVANGLTVDSETDWEFPLEEQSIDGRERGADDPSNDWEFPLAENSVVETLDRAERLIDDVREFARNASTVRSRSRVRLDRVIEEAATASRLEENAVFVERAATLRADPDRLIYLLETAFDDVAARANAESVAVRVGLTGIDEPGQSRGFFIEDDAPENPPVATDQLLDPTTEYHAAIDGLGLTLVRAIAEAHDWNLEIETEDTVGTRIDVRGVMTLEARE